MELRTFPQWIRILIAAIVAVLALCIPAETGAQDVAIEEHAPSGGVSILFDFPAMTPQESGSQLFRVRVANHGDVAFTNVTLQRQHIGEIFTISQVRQPSQGYLVDCEATMPSWCTSWIIGTLAPEQEVTFDVELAWSGFGYVLTQATLTSDQGWISRPKYTTVCQPSTPQLIVICPTV